MDPQCRVCETCGFLLAIHIAIVRANSGGKENWKERNLLS